MHLKKTGKLGGIPKLNLGPDCKAIEAHYFRPYWAIRGPFLKLLGGQRKGLVVFTSPVTFLKRKCFYKTIPF